MVRFKEGEPCCVCPCPCEGLIDIVGRKWVLCILALLGNNGTMRFNELQGQLLGISAKTLAEALKSLQQSGIVKREAFSEIPPRVQYHLTREGGELAVAVAPLMVWAEKQTGLMQLEP